MLKLFADFESVHPENALVQSNLWTWVLIIIIFFIGFLYYGLIWAIILKLFDQKNFFKKTKFYYLISIVALTNTITGFFSILIFPQFKGIIITALATVLINYFIAKYWWVLTEKQSLVMAMITSFATITSLFLYY